MYLGLKLLAQVCKISDNLFLGVAKILNDERAGSRVGVAFCT